ncbi:stress responsive A B barrel domain [Fusarium albosuccineum]|uniref:Stress responsive A B barrel domain n=1 Tax=Fusarium albosuccineum TaxID=1237068 RepID=A0A8H4P3P5_9HYPO|nr:stress responsive A B barrel domain [Fusarium albosuccineum]
MFALAGSRRGLRRLSPVAKDGFIGHSRSYVAVADRVHRVTMFKMPKAEDQERFLAQCRKMAVDNQRDGKPYILSMVAGPAEEGPRTEGYTFVNKTEFASMDDMRYYESDCPAHGEVKKVLGEITIDGMMTVFFKPQATGGT